MILLIVLFKLSKLTIHILITNKKYGRLFTSPSWEAAEAELIILIIVLFKYKKLSDSVIVLEI
jgi:hypothetical protein